MIKGSIQENVTAVNIYAPNIGAPKYIKQILTDKGRNWQSHFFLFQFFSFIFISWRVITSQHFSGFCHTLTWISHGVTCNPHPNLPSHRFLWVFPVHQDWALVSCISPGLVSCFTIDNIHAVRSKHPTIAFSHRVQKSVLYICVSFSALHIGLSLPFF